MQSITDSVRNDLMVDAIELGSNYWYLLGKQSTSKISKYIGIKKPLHGDSFYGTFSEAVMTAIDAGEQIEVHDIESPHELLGVLSKQSIKEGEEVMQEKYPYHYENILNENTDAETADVWLQCCVMKEIVFG